MTKNNRFYISWTLMMTAAIIVISANSIFVPATSYIARDLGVAEAVMSSNMVFSRSGMIVCMFCFAAFADLFTSRRLAQAGLVICTISCVLSAIATNIYVFDLAQIVEAVSRATIMLTMQLWIAGISNKDNLASRLSWYTVMITVAPILAPSVGGVIADLVSWQYCFIVLGVLSLVMLAAISMFRIVERTEQQDQAQPKASIKREQSDACIDSAEREKARPLVKAKFSPMKTLREYRQVIGHSPLLPLSFSLAWMAWFDGGYMAIVSFLFVDELGLSAAQLGGIIMIYVAGAFLGRFPIMYIQKRYGARATFIFHQAIVLLATVSALIYRLLTGHHDIIEIAVMMFVFGFGFSGMYIYCLRNSMVIDPEKKSVYTSLFNALYSIAALLGVLTIQSLYMAKFTSASIFQTLVATATVFMLVGSVLHLKALKKIDNKL